MGKFCLILAWVLCFAAAQARAETCADIHKQRQELASAESYKASAMMVLEHTLIGEHRKRAAAGARAPEVNAPLLELLQRYPLSIRGLRANGSFMAWAAADAKAQNFKEADGLKTLSDDMLAKSDLIARCIVESGDGKSMATAYKVINVAEEYGVLDYLKLKPVRQSLAASDNKFFDRLVVVTEKGEQEVFFDISSFYMR